MTTRRTVLGALGVSALGVTGFGGLALPRSHGQTGASVRSRLPLPKRFAVPLPVPPVARPVRVDAVADHYVVTQRHARQEILPGLRTPILGYDGIFPGPTIETRSGRGVVVTHRNELTVPVAVHLHGGHTPARSDGFPTDIVASPDGSVSSRAYSYPMQQRAATLWYHDHRMEFTGPQVYGGLAGFHLVHDDEEDALPLPQGERDVPLMIADRAFEEDGSFRYPQHDPAMAGSAAAHHAALAGVLGDVVLVNGAPWPVLEVAAARYRLRLLNASNARRYVLRLSPARTPLVQIGSDGGLLARPVRHTALALAAGERYDVVVDFAAYPPGTVVDLVNDAGSGSTADVMRFRVTRRVVDDSRVPSRLGGVEVLAPARAVRTRDWRFRRGAPDGPAWVVNGRGFDPRRTDATPRLGQLEVWRFTTDLRHPVHVHLDPFQVVSRRGGPAAPADGGWKDTVDVAPHETVEVAIRFTDYAGRYLLHCHNLEHEDMAMMAAFTTG